MSCLLLVQELTSYPAMAGRFTPKHGPGSSLKGSQLRSQSEHGKLSGIYPELLSSVLMDGPSLDNS
jgi:hypothetical protein